MSNRTTSGRRSFAARLPVIGVIAMAGLFVLFLLSQLLVGLTQRSEVEEVFNPAAELPPDLIDAVQWTPDPADLPRQIEPLTRTAVTSAWLRAWEQQTIVAETGDTSGLEVYYSEQALDAMIAGADQWTDRRVQQLEHLMGATFYSEDGQVMSFDVESRILRSVRVGSLWVPTTSREQYEVVMLLEDGNWRIQHMIRRSFERELIGT